MDEQRNVQVVKKGYDAFGRGDIPGLLELLDANITWVSPGPSDLPTAGTRRGHQGVGEFFQSLGTVTAIQRFEAKTFIAQDDHVVALGEGAGRVLATGKVTEFRFAHVFTLKNGKVTAFEEYSDMTDVVSELRQAQRV